MQQFRVEIILPHNVLGCIGHRTCLPAMDNLNLQNPMQILFRCGEWLYYYMRIQMKVKWKILRESAFL